MHSAVYLQARKEFVNCVVMSPICFFISLIIAFTEWMPVMKAEKQKERQAC